MFGRIVKYLLLLLVVVAIGIWFAENPGVISVQWFGVIVDVPLGLALLAGLICLGVLAVLYRFWLFLRRAPASIKHHMAEKRLHKGYEALSQGMISVAAGDAEQARTYSKKAEDILENPGMTLLLSAQAAQLEGNHQAASQFFESLSNQPGMEFLGLRGLLSQAMARGDKEKALDLATRAHRLKPKSDWLNQSLLDLQLEKGLWAEAEGTLKNMMKLKMIDPKAGHRQQAVLLTQRALELIGSGDNENARKLLQQALKLVPSFVPAAMELAKLWAKSGAPKKGISLIEDTWRFVPFGPMALLYQNLHAEPDSLKRVRLAERLADKNRAHPESRLAIARAALEAQLWGEARDELSVLMKGTPTSEVYRLMADLVESEHLDMTQARAYLYQGAQAPSDPAWVCHSCGDARPDWSATCQKCGSFDSKEWSSPAHVSDHRLEAPKDKGEVIENDPAA